MNTKTEAARHADHQALVTVLEHRVLEGPGDTDVDARMAAAVIAAGGTPAGGPYDALARQIGEAAYRVTDVQVAAAVKTAGSERAAFEIIAAATLGAGLLRWREGMRALGAATDAAS